MKGVHYRLSKDYEELPAIKTLIYLAIYQTISIGNGRGNLSS